MPIVYGYGTEDIGQLITKNMKDNPSLWTYKKDENSESFFNSKGVILYRYYHYGVKEEMLFVSYLNEVVYSFESTGKLREEIDEVIDFVIEVDKKIKAGTYVEVNKDEIRKKEIAKDQVIKLLNNKGS